MLEDVKIADPAVGSGAFLLGLLNEIVRARQTLTTYMAIEMNGFQRLNFYSYGRKTYDLKVNTIKNCLFACDLEPSATDITKLRLWLSIVIDDETVKQDDSNGMFDAHTEPRQLPNLDCNVICGNSLMDEFEGISLITESSLLNNQKEVGMESFYQAGFDNMLCELIRLQNDLYFTTDHESKRVIKEKIQNIYDKIILHQLDSSPDAIKAYYQIKNKESKPFVLWQLYFPKVFKEKQGFDIVIGNPPYGLINKKQNQNTSISANKYEIEVYKKKNIYKPAKGGIINIFRLFVCKSFDLLKDNGHLSLIFPMAFMCDLSAKSLREYILNNNKIDYIEAFPERDDENKRVFRSAKMSVCILGASKTHVDGNTKFPMRISRNPFVDLTADIAYISKNDIIKIDEKSLTIPIVSPKEFSILIKICDGGKRLKSYSKCYTGEIDLSLNKKYIRLDSKYATMVRGAQIQKFYVTNEISQGDIYYLDEEAYLSENNAKKSHHHEIPRIVMQGITGVNEKDRLKMTILKAGVYCANSVNYILIKERIYYFLGICNSKVLNWFFLSLVQIVMLMDMKLTIYQ